ncbi:FtsX-like permease family protein [Panacibacter ginsenosidivorans]|uniref:FtsX-like permease family protein n=1 Tax=Panacibacter ginsenosidivorans TaxID=1813871 RepID=A0A5B8V461_9BACT|nr:ABC transporter permease [Panacibacter ginsenosidivorans]QEC65968.1 FtsX-like permease family protein [Panacibacter ginsenosidivorans]
MFGNYFKTAWRNLVRNKAFSAINILGLALGITCSLLIILWVQDERSVDGFHTNGKQLYQVYERNYYDGKIDASYPTQGLLAEELKRVVPEVQYASSLDYAAQAGSSNTFEAANKINKMQGSFAGEDFFKMFSYHLLQGKAETALNAPNVIAISRRMAEQFFGSVTNAVGKTIRFDNKEDLQVTAVFENVPANSSVQFDFLRSWIDYVKQNDWVHNWGNTSPSTFVQLRVDANPAKVGEQIKDFIYKYQQKDNTFRMELALQPYAEKYLHSTFKNGYVDGGRIEYVRLFIIVAIFILLIACINFMNLATAQSARRAKEVGLRKVIGAARFSLIKQFIGEAMMLTFFSMIIAFTLTVLLLPAFNSLTGKQLSLPFTEPAFWFSLIGLLLVTGFIAGSYPALFLSSLKPIRVLKGSLKFSGGATFFRQAMVVLQFSLSVIFIAGMIIIYKQMDYIQTKNIGYDRENLVYIPIEGDLVKNYELLKDEATKMPGVVSVSKMRNSPTVIEHHTGSITWPGKDPNLTISFADGVVGYDFIKTMKLQLMDGRDFSKDFGADSIAFILNETAASRMGFQHAVGQTVTWGNHPGKVIGVIKDFHFNSMHQAIDPLIVRLDENWNWGTILVRTEAGKTKETLSGLEKICKELNPKFPFTFQFSDQEYTKLYNSEQVVSKLSDYFAFLAIFISCLGLFGLATFTAAQRTKEIGVRKVLGASVPNIVSLLSANFLKPVAISMLIAFPIAWYAMNQWLQGFAYKVSIDWWVFALAGLVTVCIALITVSYQSIKAALRNPVKSLRTE